MLIPLRVILETKKKYVSRDRLSALLNWTKCWFRFPNSLIDHDELVSYQKMLSSTIKCSSMRSFSCLPLLTFKIYSMYILCIKCDKMIIYSTQESPGLVDNRRAHRRDIKLPFKNIWWRIDEKQTFILNFILSFFFDINIQGSI